MIVLTSHAIRRMSERKIELAWVESVITRPDWTERDDDEALTRSFGQVAQRSKRILRVVHRPAGADVLVVTTMFDRGAVPP